MLGKLFSRLTTRPDARPDARPTDRPTVPDGTRLYAIGDIHGRLDLLRAMSQQILADAASHPTPRKIVVYLGDYVDRGDASAQVLDCLMDEPLPDFEIVHLRGNHEDSMVRFLGDAQVGPAWLAYGGRETLQSYGIRPPHSDLDLLRAQRELRERLPERHRAFLESLVLRYAEGDYFFVHAGVRPRVALEAQAEHDLLWIREPFLSSDADFGKIVVHGHSITAAPDVRPNRIGIDTGAFASGHLTTLVLTGEEVAFLAT